VNGVHARHAHGLSIWFPDVPTDPAYTDLSLSRATGWDGFLATYRSGTPTPIRTNATARGVDTTVPPDGLADAIRVDATPRANGTLVVVLMEGDSIVTAPEVLARANQTESLNLTAPHAGRFNVTVLFYVGGKLSDLVTVPDLAVQASFRFQGTVTDSRGSPVPGAAVTLQNRRTSAILVGTTDASGAYVLAAVVPDFFEDGDTLTLAASEGARQASATFVANARGTSQTANLVLGAAPADTVNPALIALSAGALVAAILLAAIVVWQREQIRGLRRRLP
jgi:hypothetical protein